MTRTTLIVGAGIGGLLAANSPETAPRCLTSSRPVIGMRLALRCGSRYRTLPASPVPDSQGVPTHE